jgi:hypothetical protein
MGIIYFPKLARVWDNSDMGQTVKEQIEKRLTEVDARFAKIKKKHGGEEPTYESTGEGLPVIVTVRSEIRDGSGKVVREALVEKPGGDKVAVPADGDLTIFEAKKVFGEEDFKEVAKGIERRKTFRKKLRKPHGMNPN